MSVATVVAGLRDPAGRDRRHGLLELVRPRDQGMGIADDRAPRSSKVVIILASSLGGERGRDRLLPHVSRQPTAYAIFTVLARWGSAAVVQAG